MSGDSCLSQFICKSVTLIAVSVECGCALLWLALLGLALLWLALLGLALLWLALLGLALLWLALLGLVAVLVGVCACRSCKSRDHSSSSAYANV